LRGRPLQAVLPKLQKLNLDLTPKKKCFAALNATWRLSIQVKIAVCLFKRFARAHPHVKKEVLFFVRQHRGFVYSLLPKHFPVLRATKHMLYLRI
jgi:hypothetical protein